MKHKNIFLSVLCHDIHTWLHWIFLASSHLLRLVHTTHVVSLYASVAVQLQYSINVSQYKIIESYYSVLCVCLFLLLKALKMSHNIMNMTCSNVSGLNKQKSQEKNIIYNEWLCFCCTVCILSIIYPWLIHLQNILWKAFCKQLCLQHTCKLKKCMFSNFQHWHIQVMIGL
jgi:hypothetical protein